MPHTQERDVDCFRFCSLIGVEIRLGLSDSINMIHIMITQAYLRNLPCAIEWNLKDASKGAGIGGNGGEFTDIIFKVRHN